MRIQQLIEQIVPNVKNIKAKSPSFYKYNQAEKVGGGRHGNFSVVKHDKHDPHMVNKFSHRGRETFVADEGFKAFIQFLINNKFTDNIHMPRVYELTTITDARGDQVIDQYKIEKLIPMDEIRREELLRYADQMMGLDDEFVRGFTGTDKAIAYAIYEAVDERTAKFPLESLNEACEIVAKALKFTGKNNDITDFNLMFRRTGNGLQLVFSDPLY